MSLYEQDLIEDFLESKFTDKILKLIEEIESFKDKIDEVCATIQYESFNLLSLNQSFENTTSYLRKLIEGEEIVEF